MAQQGRRQLMAPTNLKKPPRNTGRSTILTEPRTRLRISPPAMPLQVHTSHTYMGRESRYRFNLIPKLGMTDAQRCAATPIHYAQTKLLQDRHIHASLEAGKVTKHGNKTTCLVRKAALPGGSDRVEKDENRHAPHKRCHKKKTDTKPHNMDSTCPTTVRVS